MLPLKVWQPKETILTFVTHFIFSINMYIKCNPQL